VRLRQAQRSEAAHRGEAQGGKETGGGDIIHLHRGGLRQELLVPEESPPAHADRPFGQAFRVPDRGLRTLLQQCPESGETSAQGSQGWQGEEGQET